MKILVFTGGGIAPALNATLYGVIRAAQKRRFHIFGGMYGWASLLPHGTLIDLTKKNIDSIRTQGGSFLRSSRTNPCKDKITSDRILHSLKHHKFDAIVPIGGDDTLGAAHTLYERHHIPVVCIPKTIDNDLAATYFTPGFPTAAATVAHYIDALKQAAYGARRIFVVEVMGGKAGWLAAASALGGADCIIPPENPIPLARVIALTKKRYHENGGYAVVVVSHQARIGSLQSAYAIERDSYGITRAHLISAPLRDAIAKALGAETLIALPANIVSAADPIPLDQRIAEALGNRAIECLAQKKYGLMTAITPALRVTTVPLARAVAKTHYHNLKDTEFDFHNLRPREVLLRYLEKITGIAPHNERPYLQFLRTIVKKH